MAKGDLSDCQQRLRAALAAWEHLRSSGARKADILEARKDVLYWKKRVKALKGQNHV